MGFLASKNPDSPDFLGLKKPCPDVRITNKCPDEFFDPDISKKKMSGFQIRTNVRILECPDSVNFYRFFVIFFPNLKCPDYKKNVRIVRIKN